MNKNLIYTTLGALAISFSACEKKINASEAIDESKIKQAEERDAKIGLYPTLTFASQEHDFGTINEGDLAEHVYTFTNTGETELLIIDVKPSCGCTVPEFTKEPITLNGTGEIKIVFDSNGKAGEVNKTVTVVANTKEGQHELKFKAKVNPKK
jgi:hypothetical protein